METKKINSQTSSQSSFIVQKVMKKKYHVRIVLAAASCINDKFSLVGENISV